MGTLGSTRGFHVSHHHFQVVTPGFPQSLLVNSKPQCHPLPSLSPCVRHLASSPKSLSIAFSLPDDASSGEFIHLPPQFSFLQDFLYWSNFWISFQMVLTIFLLCGHNSIMQLVCLSDWIYSIMPIVQEHIFLEPP